MHKMLSSLALILLCTQSLFSDDWFAYVACRADGVVTPVNISTSSPLPDITTGPNSRSIAITPDRLTAFAVNASSNDVTPIDTLTNTAGTNIPVGANPQTIAITPDGTYAYVTNFSSSDITRINTSDFTTDTAFTFGAGNEPLGIAISPDGTKAYVTVVGGFFADQVVQLDITTNPATFDTSVPVGVFPYAIAIKPDGSKAYVVNLSNANVTPIDLTGPVPIPEPPIFVGSIPNGIAITADGQTIFVSVFADSKVVVIEDDVVVDDIDIPNPTGGLAVTPDGLELYVTSANDTLILVDISDMAIGSAIDVADRPFDVAITPDQAPTASFVVSPASAGSPTFFDASSSTSPVGTVVLFEWDFGDGTTASTPSPTISHTYLLPNTYTVTLTVTNSAGTSTTQTFTGRTVSNNGGPSAVISQQITIEQGVPFPPSDFTGVIKVNKFLNKRECLLKATWTASPTDTVAFYRIFRNGVVVATVPAVDPFIFKTCLHGCSANGFEIAAVSASGFESEHIALEVEDKKGSN